MYNQPPAIMLFSEDRRVCHGVLQNMFLEFEETVRFNACSELTFKIPNQIYDPNAQKFIYNDTYDKIEKNRLLYVCDDKEYFSFPIKQIRTDYGIAEDSTFASNSTDGLLNFGRTTGENSTSVKMTYENHSSSQSALAHFKVQPETPLFYISMTRGYNWQNMATLTEFGYDKFKSGRSTGYGNVACPNFIPIQPEDVISVRNRYSKNSTPDSSIRFAQYEIYFYTEDNADSYVGDIILTYNGSYNSKQINPVFRFSVNSLTLNDGFRTINSADPSATTQAELDEFKAKMANGGYIRVCAIDHRSNASAADAHDTTYASYITENGTIGWSFPYDGWLIVYSGQRMCSVIENTDTIGTYSLPMHWFVITDIQEETDGFMTTKTVSAKSYEYTIGNRTISLSESTLPFYIPPAILDIVNSDVWVIDKEKGASTVIHAAQKMDSGLLNQILEVLPGWTVGHISSELMTRYRAIPDTDNSNLYSFLMSDIETLYQCFFVFDCDNCTISAYTIEDIKNADNVHGVLNWENALKTFSLKSKEANYITSLRMHTADDTYSVGFINPTGNAIIYNFNYLLNRMEFVADSSNSDPLNRNKIYNNGTFVRYRTLREAVEAWQSFLTTPQITLTGLTLNDIKTNAIAAITNSSSPTVVENPVERRTNQSITINNLTDYREKAKQFVELTLSIIQMESAISNLRARYQSIVDKIRSYAEANSDSSYFAAEAVRKPSDLQGWYTAQPDYFINSSLFNELYDASVMYHTAVLIYQACKENYDVYYSIFKYAAQKTSLNYHKQVAATTSYTSGDILSILTPAEIQALQPFIIEGDWTNEYMTFSDDYGADDIISTLLSTYQQAKTDLDQFLYCPDYDFEITTANLVMHDELSTIYNNLKVGQSVVIHTRDTEFIQPILLELHIDYINPDSFSMTFTTDYRRKPIQFRFADLYNAISQTSVVDNTFTFAE